MDSNLPGYDVLTRKGRMPASLDGQDLAPYLHEDSHREYLKDGTYRRYLKLPKGFVDEQGAYGLIETGDLLACQQLPRFKDAAGWAYAEAGLVLASETTVSRVELLEEAQKTWEESLAMTDALKEPGIERWLYEDSAPYRTALNLAYVQIMKSLVVGNVTKGVRQRTFSDTLAIAQSSLVQRDLAAQTGNIEAVGEHVGFLHECNALLSLLYLDDPRYVPLPSSSRADSGYYYQRQAHDIVIINQHYGTIKKVIPMEIKATASQRDRSRYKALIIRGKMHLAVPGKYNPRNTVEAFAAVTDETASQAQRSTVNHVSTTVRYLLDLYQKGRLKSDDNSGGITKFHDNTKVAPYYVNKPDRHH